MFMAASFITFIPRFGATGVASPTLVSSLTLAGLTLLSARLSDHDHARRAPSDLTPTEPVPNANY
jgi:hypothetical protein